MEGGYPSDTRPRKSATPTFNKKHLGTDTYNWLSSVLDWRMPGHCPFRDRDYCSSWHVWKGFSHSLVVMDRTGCSCLSPCTFSLGAITVCLYSVQAFF